MKIVIPFASTMVACIILAGTLGAADRVVPEDEKLWEYLTRHRREMVRIMKQPFRVNSRDAQLCRPQNFLPHSPHGNHWIQVSISPGGTNAMATGKGTYPVGTMILKQKFLDAEGKKTELYTGMRKRKRGHNPKAGDWEFFTLNSQGSRVTARGKIDSCMNCHAKYKSTDFVSRRYLTETADKPW